MNKRGFLFCTNLKEEAGTQGYENPGNSSWLDPVAARSPEQVLVVKLFSPIVGWIDVWRGVNVRHSGI